MDRKLVFYKNDNNELIRCLISDAELITLVDESDFTNIEIVKILDVTDPENIREIRYAGWKPRMPY